MPSMSLVIGNKNYSTWSLRGWLALKRTAVPFDEIFIPLDRPGFKQEILSHSAAGRVPILKHGDQMISDSLAIGEYLAEAFPEAGLWPEYIQARAQARTVSSEMHSGFAALRTHMPMDLRNSFPGRGRGSGVDDDIERIIAVWTQCRRQYGSGGSFLFGTFTLADAMFAPVIGRFRTYGVELPDVCQSYCDAVWALPEMIEWLAAAKDEPWVIEQPVI